MNECASICGMQMTLQCWMLYVKKEWKDERIGEIYSNPEYILTMSIFHAQIEGYVLY